MEDLKSNQLKTISLHRISPQVFCQIYSHLLGHKIKWIITISTIEWYEKSQDHIYGIHEITKSVEKSLNWFYISLVFEGHSYWDEELRPNQIE